MKELDMCKAFTLMELNAKYQDAKSIEFDERQSCYWVEGTGFSSWPILNPITDLTLLAKAMFKYEVEVDYDDKACFIYTNEHREFFEVAFEAKGDIPNAVIECILKSKGKWVDNE